MIQFAELAKWRKLHQTYAKHRIVLYRVHKFISRTTLFVCLQWIKRIHLPFQFQFEYNFESVRCCMNWFSFNSIDYCHLLINKNHFIYRVCCDSFFLYRLDFGIYLKKKTHLSKYIHNIRLLSKMNCEHWACKWPCKSIFTGIL